MLQLDRGKFYRIKNGQTLREVEKVFCIPVNECFGGAVIEISDCKIHTVKPFETYAVIAQSYETEEESLKNFNGNRPLYPTCKIFIPKL